MGKAMMGTGSGHGEDRALEAATGATQSPLLDDINLKGARGILCNITAGADLSMHEFQQVGDVIEDIAATDANVVIGTSIDKEMEGEIRVTVVATGLAEDRSKKPMRLVSSDEKKSTSNYAKYEEPAAGRMGKNSERRVRSRVRQSTEEAQPKAGKALDLANVEREDDELDYLDLPTFLRRQAD
jgi:cell division protein FtsZ